MTSLPPTDCASMPPRQVTLGGLDRAGLRAALEVVGVRFNALALRLFDSPLFKTSPQPYMVETVMLRVRDLGFADGARMPVLMEAARRRGLQPCALELGPHLRLQFRHQVQAPSTADMAPGRAPPGSLTVLSRPLQPDHDFPKGFYLRRFDGELWLRGYRSDDEHLWAPDDQLLFLCP